MENGSKVNKELKKFDATPSGRPSIIKGAKYQRGFTINPGQILALFHDTHPELPIPGDAQFQGIGLQDAGVDSKIEFYFTSITAPWEHCFALKPEYFFKLLVQLADGLLPLDSELDGMEISPRFTLLLMRVKSSHWAPAPSTLLPLYHLRYDLGRLCLHGPEQALRDGQRQIRIQ